MMNTVSSPVVIHQHTHAQSSLEAVEQKAVAVKLGAQVTPEWAETQTARRGVCQLEVGSKLGHTAGCWESSLQTSGHDL